MNLTNPASNTVAITSYTLSLPSGYTVSNCDYEGSYLNDCTNGASSVTWYSSSSVGLVPGAEEEVLAYITWGSRASYPATGVATSSWIDSAGTSHAGSSITFFTFSSSATDPVVTATGGSCSGTTCTFRAGSSGMTYTANIGVSNANVLVTFSSEGAGKFSGTGLTCVHDWLCYAKTSTSGTVSVKYQPSNSLGTATIVTSIGNVVYAFGTYAPSGCEYCWGSTTNNTVTLPAAPSQTMINLPGNDTSYSTYPNHYITNGTFDDAGNPGASVGATGITLSVADKFGNHINFNALNLVGESFIVSLTAVGGSGRFVDNFDGVHATTITNGTTTNFATLAYWGSNHGSIYLETQAGVAWNYFQSSTYGTTSKISATIKAVNNTWSAPGTSGTLITSTFAAASPTSSATGGGYSATPAGHVNVGSVITVSANVTSGTPGAGCGAALLCVNQKGVPVEFFLDASSTQVNGNGNFTSNGAKTINVTSSSAANASATFAVDTGKGAVLYFQDLVSQPIDGAPHNNLGNATLVSNSVTTDGGKASKLHIYVGYGPDATGNFGSRTSVIPGVDTSVVILMTDKYGNAASNTALGQIQLALQASSGLLSATTIYIAHGDSGSNGTSSFGPVTWTTPSSPDTATLSVTGVLNSKSVSSSITVAVVSPTPSMAVTSPAPYNGVIYTNSLAPTFTGWAAISAGYNSTTTIAAVGYLPGGATVWQNAGITTGLANTTWTASLALSAGKNTVKFNATDTNANVVYSSSSTVLVDTSTPYVNFTTANGSNLTSGATVSAALGSNFGDLNMSSGGVVATANGTVIPSSRVTITGANALGSVSNFTVSISGLSAGTWDLGLSASSYAGNTGTASDIIVHVSVPANQVFTATTPTVGTSSTGFRIITATWTNNGVGSVTADITFEIFQGTTSGAPVALGIVEATSAAGSTSTFSFGIPSNLAAGSYTAAVFVTVAGSAYSQVYTVQFTVS